MPWLVPAPIPDEASRSLMRMLGELAERLDDPTVDKNDLVRDLLAQLLYGRRFQELSETSPWASFSLDPRNVVFEAERYVATDQERFQAIKPLLWAWQQADYSPFGQSLASGFPFRRMLAERIFGAAGRNLKVFPHVEVSVGYNLEVGDDVVLHRHVLVDDIGGVEIHDGASLSDHVSVYSHTHDVRDPTDVTLKRTVIGRGVRLAYHATVLAGTVVSDDSMLGAMAVATRDVAPHEIALGIPARPHQLKPRPEPPTEEGLAVNARARPPEPGVRANPEYAEGAQACSGRASGPRDGDG